MRALKIFLPILFVACVGIFAARAQNVSSPPIVAVQSASTTALGGDVALPAATTTTVLSKVVTMPSSGCPCRALVSQSLMTTNTSGTTIDSWISDGTNTMASAQTWASGAGGPGCAASAFSPVTYANGAVITFTFFANSGTAATAKATPGTGTGQGTWMQVAVMTSN